MNMTNDYTATLKNRSNSYIIKIICYSRFHRAVILSL